MSSNRFAWLKTAVRVWAIGALAGLSAQAARKTESQLPDVFQARIVELFSQNRCDEITEKTTPKTVNRLRPNVMAIVAACAPGWGSSEDIFKRAEELSPTGDLILVLHARYRMARDWDSAEPLWTRVLLIARNPAFRQMAKDYFAGVKGSTLPLNLNAETIFGSVTVGADQSSNPRPEEFVFDPTHGSGGLLGNVDLTWRHWYPWGSLAVKYDLDYRHYFEEPLFDLNDQELQIPFALHVTTVKDIVFEPIGGYTRVGNALYSTKYGIGVSGVVYQNTYKQSVKGLVYQEQVDAAQLTALSAAHYRFEYSWEFFPEFRYFSALIWIEHASASTESTFNGIQGTFPFSNNTVGTDFKFEQNLRTLSIGIIPRFFYRIDTDDSAYPLATTGELVTKRRADWNIDIQPYVSIPILPSVELYAWYEYKQVLSNMGPTDYANRNQTDNTVGVALKAALSTY